MNAPDPIERKAAPVGPADPARRFIGVARLYGAAVAERLARSHAVVVGIGGVGSWTAEALARSGVGRLTLIDLDHIAESNVNRQIHALEATIGRAKVLAMAERIAAINPRCAVQPVEEFVAPDNVAAVLPAADVVVDCIDQLRAKAALVAHCRDLRRPLVVCGAAGGRVDPTRIRRDDLARTVGDPLLAKLRARLRRDHGFAREDRRGRRPRFGVIAVYSDEPVRAPLAAACDLPVTQGLACSGYGSSVTVTASLGFAAAAAALAWLSGAAAAPSGS